MALHPLSIQEAVTQSVIAEEAADVFPLRCSLLSLNNSRFLTFSQTGRDVAPIETCHWLMDFEQKNYQRSMEIILHT